MRSDVIKMLLEGGYLSTGNPTGGPGKPTTKTATSSTRLATEQATADDLPDYTQNETSPGSNLFDTVTPEDVEARLSQEAWFNPNDPMFGEGGFDVTNSDHVTAYQEMYNELAPEDQQIQVDGDWGKQTQTAHIPMETIFVETEDGGGDGGGEEIIPDPPEPTETEGKGKGFRGKGRAGIAGDKSRLGGRSAYRGIFGIRKKSRPGRGRLFRFKPKV